jgi:hypothetical protein
MYLFPVSYLGLLYNVGVLCSLGASPMSSSRCSFLARRRPIIRLSAGGSCRPAFVKCRTTSLPGGNTTRCGYSTINGSANPYYFQIQTQSSQLSSHHHPDVKLIPKLQDKSKGEQIMRCTDRMKNSPATVETLLKALSAARQNPDTDKFRHIVLKTIAAEAFWQPSVNTAGFSSHGNGRPGDSFPRSDPDSINNNVMYIYFLAT